MTEEIGQVLKSTQAGLRLIAQMTLYNSGDFERLADLIRQSYESSALLQQSVEERVAVLQNLYTSHGRMRIVEVPSSEKHYLSVRIESESGQKYSIHLNVTENFPHLITEYLQRPILVE